MLHHTKKGERYLCEKGILYYSYVKNLDEDPQYFQLVACKGPKYQQIILLCAVCMRKEYGVDTTLIVTISAFLV